MISVPAVSYLRCSQPDVLRGCRTRWVLVQKWHDLLGMMYVHLFSCLRLRLSLLERGPCGRRPDWPLLMKRLGGAGRAALGPALTLTPPLDCRDTAQTWHVNITYSCRTRCGKGGTLISGMNKHGRRHASPELLCAKEKKKKKKKRNYFCSYTIN